MRAAVTALAFLTFASSASAFGHHFPQKIDVNVPPGGTATVESGTIPPTAKSATYKSSEEDNGIFKAMVSGLAKRPTPGARILACVNMYTDLKNTYPEDDEEHDTSDKSLQVLFLAACLKMAVLINQITAAGGTVPRAVAAPAAARCKVQAVAVPIRVTRSGGRYHMKIHGKVRNGGSKLVTTCKRTSRGLTLKVRPRNRHKTLRQVVGPKLGITYYNPDTARSAKIRTSFAVR